MANGWAYERMGVWAKRPCRGVFDDVKTNKIAACVEAVDAKQTGLFLFILNFPSVKEEQRSKEAKDLARDVKDVARGDEEERERERERERYEDQQRSTEEGEGGRDESGRKVRAGEGINEPEKKRASKKKPQ